MMLNFYFKVMNCFVRSWFPLYKGEHVCHWLDLYLYYTIRLFRFDVIQYVDRIKLQKEKWWTYFHPIVSYSTRTSLSIVFITAKTVFPVGSTYVPLQNVHIQFLDVFLSTVTFDIATNKDVEIFQLPEPKRWQKKVCDLDLLTQKL